MDDSIPVYSYTSIDEEEDIRVLKLEPATSFTDPIVASLFVRKLHDPLDQGHPLPSYHCVSYCWGTQHDMSYIMCDSRRLKITQSVDIMLRHLRKLHAPRNLWIDAICINQTDNTEKARHVRVMGTIYQRADKVHVWLGPASVNDQIALIFAALKTWAFSSLDQHPLFDLTGTHSSISAPLGAFLARPWFTRRWIIQEVMLARNAIVHCGTHRLSWSWICDGLARFQSDYARNYIFGPCSNIVSAETARTLKGLGSIGSQPKSRFTILQLLWDHHSSKCQDGRDCIYALYGMLLPPKSTISNPTFEEIFEPSLHCPVDYSKHFSAVYMQLAIAAIREADVLTILSHAVSFGSLADQNIAWPSWVPSWNKMRRSQGLPSFRSSGSRQGPRRTQSATVESTDDRTCLVLEGTIYPITHVQTADEAEKITEFFSASHWPSWSERLHPIRLLVRGVQDAGYLNDRTSFNFETMFPDQDADGGIAREYSNTFSKLELYLKHEIGYEDAQTQDENLEYDWDAISGEISRVLKNHAFVVYGHDKGAAPGIASPGVKEGDYMYRPDGLAKSSEHALVLQRTKSGEHDKLGRKTFRIIGYCLHSPNSNVFSESARCTVLLD